MNPSELKCIVIEAQKRFEEMVRADEDAAVFTDLLMVEEAVAALTQTLGLTLVQRYVDVRKKQAKAARRRCACGRQTALHRSSKWTRQTPFGPITVDDPYAYCRLCRHAERPLHRWLGTARDVWSLPVQQAAVDLASDESCGNAVSKLARHHRGVEMGRTTALRLLHAHGKAARSFIDDKLARAPTVAELPRTQREGIAEELEVEFDCGMIPVATLAPIPCAEGQAPERTPVRGLPKRRKDCRWEEVKAGLIQKPGEIERLYTLRPTGCLDEAFDDLFALSCMSGWHEQTQVRGIADGAIHIRLRMEETFHGHPFRFILDRPHAKEHLSNAGTQLESSTGIPAQQWASSALKQLERGQAAEVVAELQQAYEASGLDEASRNDTLRLEAGYFERNQDAVAYAEYRQHGWSTASSEIESGHRHLVQTRLKISGAWWHPDTVDDVLALRMLKANGWWDDYWETRRDAWRAHAQTLARN